jgi:hypothetical protein
MATGDDTVRVQIERTIEEAREGLSERIDQLDKKLRKELDLNKIASEHAVQLMGAGAAIGFVLGIGVPRAVLRLLQIGIPIGLAIAVAKRAHELQEECQAAEGADSAAG